MAEFFFPTRSAIASAQIRQLRELLAQVLGSNRFYQKKFAAAGVTSEVTSLEEFSRRVPFTTKQEIVADQKTAPPYGTNLTFPLVSYTRCHQTSGTSSTPLRWLDTPENWRWMLQNWKEVYRAAGVTRADRILFAFSFGPFIGFWLAFESAAELGCLCLPGGGLSSGARLRLILDQGVTVVCCTPTYAIHLAEVAAEEKIELDKSELRMLIVAGEPGGSIPATRSRIEQLWGGARVFDHHGMTEVGPVTYECPSRPGVLHVMECAYFAEIIDPATGTAAPPGAQGELVLTTLGRIGSPLVRYRTGDLVKPGGVRITDYALRLTPPESPCPCGRSELALEGGILGRTDDMVTVRGVNVFPGAVEEIIRGFREVAEYQVEISDRRALAELRVRVEPVAEASAATDLTARVERALLNALALRVPVTLVQPGTLPRYELKAKRWLKK
ncbi:MAG: phenylacetate--CoA ligase [Verrucomicrobia bacterium]|nr:phenylacetate--CoA ligase [Verrucomicrobiota bacterium]